MNPRTQAIIDVNIGVAVFFLQDLVIKLVAGSYPITQLLIVRCLTALPILIWLVHKFNKNHGLGPLKSPRYPILLARGAIAVVAYTSYYLAFPVLPIANILALFSITPICLALFGVVFLGETLVFKQIMAILLGFTGSLVVLRPGLGVFEYASLLPILAAVSYSFSQTINRKYLADDSPPVVAVYQTSCFLLASTLGLLIFNLLQLQFDHPAMQFLTRGLATFDMRDLLLIALTGPISSVGLIYLSKAYRAAPAGVVGPFEYGALVLAVLCGYIFWNEVPDTLSIIGSVMIIISGIIIIKK